MKVWAAIFGIALSLLAVPARADDGADTLAIVAAGGTGGWVNTERPLTVADFKGRVLLLDFWTYGCINCMQVIPDLTYLENKFPQLLVIGVHSAKYAGEGLSDNILKATRRFGIHHPVMNDNDFKVWDHFNVQAWPTLVLLDDQGREIARYAGEGHRQQLEDKIADAVESLPAALAGKNGALVTAADASGALSFPSHLIYADTTPWGPSLIIGDTSHNRIVFMNTDGKLLATVGLGTAGLKDGNLNTAQFNMPRGLALVNGILYVADTGNHALRAVDLKAGIVTTLAGNGTRGDDYTPDDVGNEVEMASPWDVQLLPDGKTLAIASAGTHQLWQYNIDTHEVSVLAGTGAENIADGPAKDAKLAQPSGLSLLGNDLYFIDAETSSLRVLHDGQVKTLIGVGLFDFGRLDGQYPKASMQHAQGLFATPGKIYVADTYNNALRVYDLQTKTLSTLRLQGVTLSEPGDVTVVGNTAYLTDSGHGRIVAVDVTTGAAKALNTDE